MTHKDVLEKLREFYPLKDNSIEVWFPNGKNSVRVRLNNKTELIFTYCGPRKWRLETVECFMYGFEKVRRG